MAGFVPLFFGGLAMFVRSRIWIAGLKRNGDVA